MKAIKQRCVIEAIQAINTLVLECSFEDALDGISILRRHLESRAEQTRPLDPPENNEDLL